MPGSAPRQVAARSDQVVGARTGQAVGQVDQVIDKRVPVLPAQFVVVGAVGLGDPAGQDLDRAFVWQNAGGLAFAAAGAGVRMNRRHEDSMGARAFIVRHFKRDRIVNHRTDPVTNVASEPESVEAGFLVDQDGHAHGRASSMFVRPLSSAPVGQTATQGISSHISQGTLRAVK